MIYATNGARFFMCTTPQTSEPDTATYQGLTWEEIKEMESVGSLGDTANEIAFSALDANRVKRVKGVRDAGTLEIVAGIDYADAGQLALFAAEKTKSDYAFKVLFNDAPEGGTPSERYFIAMPNAVTEVLDAADNILKLNASLWVNSGITRVSAAAP